MLFAECPRLGTHVSRKVLGDGQHARIVTRLNPPTGTWDLIYTTTPGASGGKLGPFIGEVTQEVDIAEGLYINYVRVGPLTGELEAKWEVTNDTQWKVMKQKSTYDDLRAGNCCSRGSHHCCTVFGQPRPGFSYRKSQKVELEAIITDMLHLPPLWYTPLRMLLRKALVLLAQVVTAVTTDHFFIPHAEFTSHASLNRCRSFSRRLLSHSGVNSWLRKSSRTPDCGR